VEAWNPAHAAAKLNLRFQRLAPAAAADLLQIESTTQLGGSLSPPLGAQGREVGRIPPSGVSEAAEAAVLHFAVLHSRGT